MGEVKPRSLVPADLNEGQKEAYIQMRSFIEAHGDEMYLLEGYAGTGKAQPLHSKILTPDGWTTMGEIVIGSQVISGDGSPCKVTGIFPQGERQIYRVHFSDGSFVECCDEHLWTVQSYNQRNGSGKWTTLPLNIIRKNLTYCGRINYNIPLVDAVQYSKQDIPMDSYLLGLLLGDGCISQKTVVRFSSSDMELIESVSESCATMDCKFNQYATNNGHVEGGIVGELEGNKVMYALRDLGLQGTTSKTKFIPNIYLKSAVADRIALLQGLLDTDGHFSRYNLCYSTSSKKLKDGIVELVRSLGGVATFSTKRPTYIYKGVKRQGAMSYNVTIKLPVGIEPFRLKRKLVVHIPKTKYAPERYIKKVESIGVMECQCISVDHESHLYLTDDYVVTHNTYLVGKILRYVKDKHPNWRIAVTAPTNKAVKVLKRSGSINDSKVKFQTIHKLLGLKEEITVDGKQIFTRNKYEECSIEEHHVIIIDEVSMLNDDLFQEIQQYGGVVKIIFIGDPAQIPPVGRADCIPFKEDGRKKYKIKRYLLTEIMRQTEGNPILETGFALRDDLNNPSSPIPKATKLNEKGHGLDFVDFSDPAGRARLSTLLEEYFVNDDFRADSDHAKVIAWRNKTVDRLNYIIRSLIYKDEEMGKIMVGEKLVANKPIMDKYKIMLFTTNDEFEVVATEILHRTIASDTAAIRLQYYHVTVEYFDIRGQRQTRKIDILHEKSAVDFNSVLKGLKNYALSKKGYDAKKAWVKYYEFMRQFADVGYNYAITAHKCVHEDSRVLTPSGWIRIKDIEVGSKVWSKSDFHVVTNKWTSVKPGLSITTRTGRTLLCSAEHNVKQFAERPYFVEGGNLKVGDFLLTPRKAPSGARDDLMWLDTLINNQRRGKTNIDHLPLKLRSMMKDHIVNNIECTTGRGSKGKGLMGSEYADTFKWVFYSNIKKFTYAHLESLCEACQNLGIPIPDGVQDALDNRYFFDEIVDISQIPRSPMVDIEVDSAHEFNCEGFSVHNCQGSTYKNVFIMEDDIDTNHNIFERNRIKYTAYTRASDTVFVIKS